MTIISPLYVQNYTEQLNTVLQYYNCLGGLHEVIVIDDCSTATIPYKDFPSIKFARIETNLMWNMPGARNLGAHLSTQSQLLFIDIDHLPPYKLDVAPNGTTLFKRLHKGKEIKHSQGCVAINKIDFKGYDEDFVGNYGKEDKLFLNIHGKTTVTDQYFIVLNPNTYSLTRDTTVNQKLYDNKIKDVIRGKYKVPPLLNFKWKLI
jgi:hypothetical protein